MDVSSNIIVIKSGCKPLYQLPTMAAMAAMLAIAAMAQYQCHCHGAKLWLKHLPKTRLRKVLGNFLTEMMIRMVRVAKQQTEASNSDNNKKW